MSEITDEQKHWAKTARTARVIAVIDTVLGFICAANGNLYFVWFIILAGFMWAYGVYTQSKANNLQGE